MSLCKRSFGDVASHRIVVCRNVKATYLHNIYNPFSTRIWCMPLVEKSRCVGSIVSTVSKKHAFHWKGRMDGFSRALIVWTEFLLFISDFKRKVLRLHVSTERRLISERHVSRVFRPKGGHLLYFKRFAHVHVSMESRLSVFGRFTRNNAPFACFDTSEFSESMWCFESRLDPSNGVTPVQVFMKTRTAGAFH